MPRKKLTKADVEHIIKHKDDKSAAEISKEIFGVGEKTVQKVIDDNNQNKTIKDIVDNPNKKKKKKSRTMQMMTGKHKGVIVMTPGASEMGDDSYKKMKDNKPDLSDRVHYMDEE